jgi:hypothetical protein
MSDQEGYNMITYRQHRPGYIELSTDPEAGEAGSLSDLLALPWVASWERDPDGLPFYRWAFAPYGRRAPEGRGLLMATYADGTKWWVVAILSENPGLPIWVPNHGGV